MNWSDVSLGFQVMWLITRDLVLPATFVSGLIWLAVEYMEAIKYWLQVASRTVSWVLLKAAWAIIYVIDGKEVADKRF